MTSIDLSCIILTSGPKRSELIKSISQNNLFLNLRDAKYRWIPNLFGGIKIQKPLQYLIPSMIWSFTTVLIGGS